MMRKPAFWILSTLLSIGCISFAVKYFPDAFPLVSLDLRMDRDQALSRAAELAENHGWGPESYDQAASFELDGLTQHYVELEAGGNEAFSAMLAGDLYAPYKWEVRHFQQGEIRQVRIFFTPAGEFYGFREQLPEDEAGPALEKETALAIAEAASSQFGIELGVYQRIEASQEIRPGGRVDHRFVYERPAPQVGEGHYRLRLEVGGERLTGLVHFVKVPEGFSRRYQEMRSANNTIAAGASIFMSIVYILGSIVGLFFLLRQGWALWRTARYWGLFVAALQALAALNQLPLSWMGYDTAVTTTAHIVDQLLGAATIFVGMTLLLTLSFIAAESLSRRAFPHHVQLWRLWSPAAGSSPQVLAGTIGAYLLVGFTFAYVVAFYFLNSRLLDWWSPSGILFEPNVLAVHFPWFNALALSLQAGFWEECLFRAVPLAGAALLGQRFGHRRLWIGAAFLIQIAIFGAGHANYPAQPAYARVVELIVPAALFGALYLAYGLLPAIVLHFAYDVVWFALPLFVSTAPGLWLDRALVVLLTLTPLWIVLYRRWRAGAWSAVPAALFNSAWVPPVAPEAETPPLAPAGQSSQLGGRARTLLYIGGLIGLGLWLYTTPFESPNPRLEVSRGEALELAHSTLSERQIELSAPWRPSAQVMGSGDDFVWREGGPEVYKDLLGAYLTPPHWLVRYARFDEETPVAERAEQYFVYISAGGKVLQVVHRLPEERPGATLEEETARLLAHQVLQQRFELRPEVLEEISATPQKRPARRDWTFTFRDSLNYPLATGEARLSVTIAGDEVTSSKRFVHVPEEWRRQERERTDLLGKIKITLTLVLILGALALIVGAILSWRRGHFATPTFVRVLILFAALGLIREANKWTLTEHGFSTAEPLSHQIPLALAGALLLPLFMALLLALLAGFAHVWQRPSPSGTAPDLAAGLALAALIAGAQGLIVHLSPSLQAFSPMDNGAAHYLPLLSAILAQSPGYLFKALLPLLVVSALGHLTAAWTRRRGLGAAAATIAGLIAATLAGESTREILLGGLLMGPLFLALYLGVLRFQPRLLLVAAAAGSILNLIQITLLNVYPGAWISALLALIGVAVLAWWTTRLLSQSTQGGGGETL